ncbi:MAG: alkaline phosphatase family protein, partial [Acidimicrobiales bacterium]
MARDKLLVLGLDGWDHALAERLQATGDLPALVSLRGKSATYLLDPEGRQLDGLDWEHFVSGLGPEQSGYLNAFNFDRDMYDSWQEGTRYSPFFETSSKRAAIFDVPYLDLERAPSIQGVQGWGMSDRGFLSASSRPDSLLGKLSERLGPYPSQHWLDGVSWPSIAQTKAMRAALVNGLDHRREAARWLLGEAITDWEIAFVGVTETHSAAEGFWHGVDPEHPLAQHPSASEAGEALGEVYRHADRLVGDLCEYLDPTHVVVFALNGMASNRFDVPSMCLMPELLYRWATGRKRLVAPYKDIGDATGSLGPDLSWDSAYPTWLSQSSLRRLHIRSAAARLRRRSVGSASGVEKAEARPGPSRWRSDWHPAMSYRDCWHRMRAFALPSYSVGRIRLNLKGRGGRGVVEP